MPKDDDGDDDESLMWYKNNQQFMCSNDTIEKKNNYRTDTYVTGNRDLNWPQLSTYLLVYCYFKIAVS